MSGAGTIDDLLRLRLGLTTLGGLLLSVLLREMVTHHTAAYRADNRMMPRIVTRHSTYDGALQASRGVCRSCRCQCQHGNRESGFDRTGFHESVVPRSYVARI